MGRKKVKKILCSTFIPTGVAETSQVIPVY